MTAIGMKQIRWYGKCEADKVTSGKYEVPAEEAGTYALVFDNTFSKTIAKSATFVLVVYPTAYPPLQIPLAANPEKAAVGIPNGMMPPPKSPGLRPSDREAVESLSRTTSQQSMPTLSGLNVLHHSDSSGQASTTHTGVLSKRRRKRHQGYARRFFSLDYTSSTLSYYHHRNSSALRGAIPLSLAAIGANRDAREISIDSGAEIWHLRAHNKADFELWTKALEKASKLMMESRSHGESTSEPQSGETKNTAPSDDREWAQIEAIVGRVSGIRDAVRRLTQSTENGLPSSVSVLADSASNASDVGSLDEQKADERRRGSFWRRKASGNQPALFRRSASASQAISPSPTDSPILRPSKSRSQLSSLPERPRIVRHGSQSDEDMHAHCVALLHDLDAVVADFSQVLLKKKQTRASLTRRADSRLSMQSTESEVFYDAEDDKASTFLTIRDDSDRDGSDGESSTDDLGSSSDFDADDFGFPKRIRTDTSTAAFPSKPKALAPLPLKPIQRRAQIPPATILPPSLIGFLRKNVGKDLSTIAMPVSANEPTSLLQRAAEQFEYSSLLDSAASATDSVERLIYTTAFAISSLSSARVRERAIRKPFNPMLGETYELVREDQSFRFIAEKISHRPVQLAFQAESTSNWSVTQAAIPTQKFWGKSSEIITEGKIRLKLHGVGECLSWTPATTFLRNIIAGEKYVEPTGTMTIVNETTGQKCIITFKTKGMFSGRSEELTAHAIDAHGSDLPLGLSGTWTSSLHLTQNGHVTDKVIWQVGPLVADAPKHYGMTLFASQLNEITPIEEGHIPPTDSRLRPDQRALEDGDHETAETLKNQLEERQRTRRKVMEEEGEKWQPRWFVPVPNEEGGDGDEAAWKLRTGKDGYWEERARDQWTGIPNVLGISEASGVEFKHQPRGSS